MNLQHLNAIDISGVETSDEFDYLIGEINTVLESTDNRHDQYPIFGHIISILSEIPAAGIDAFTTALTSRPLILGFFRSDYEGVPHSEEGLVLSFHLDIGIDITVDTDSPEAVLRRGGWEGGAATLQNVLDGVAGMLSDAAQKVLNAFLRTGEVEPSGTMISLSEAIGGADLVREEAKYDAETLTDDEYEKSTKVSDEAIDSAIHEVAETPLGARISDRLNDAMDRKTMEVLTDILGTELGLLRAAAIRIAIGADVDLDTIPDWV